MKTRRHSLIWLGLVLPTLAVGALALGLLGRERHRLEALALGTAREQALTVADNLELIFAEVQTGVSQALEVALARGSALGRLEELARTNPLVSGYFVLSPALDGPYVLVSGDVPEAELEVYLDAGAPSWLTSGALAKEKPEAPAEARAEELAEASPAEPSPGVPVASGTEGRYDFAVQSRQVIRDITMDNISSLDGRDRRQYGVEAAHGLALAPEAALPVSRFVGTPRQASGRNELNLEDAMAADVRWGWLARRGGEPGWLAWREVRRDGQVGGLILNTEFVLAQLRAAFPRERSSPLVAVLRDPDGISVLDSGNYGKTFGPGASGVVPVGGGLEGWALAFRVPDADNGGMIFLLGALMVGSLCATTLGAGTLLLMQARRDAREAVRKTTFVSNVSHELRTPLTTIRMYAEMLEEGRLSDEAKRKRYLGTIASESQRLSRLIDNVLDFSRIEQGRKQYQREALDVREVIEGVLLTQGPRLHEAQMVQDWERPEAEATVVTDRDALEQVLLNLIDNGIKYAAQGGRLRVALEPGSGVVRVRVEDAGPGIRKRDRERVFQAFQRLDDNLTAAQPGTGLGLSISRSLLRELGGDLLLEDSEGGGCCFVIVLPVAVSV